MKNKLSRRTFIRSAALEVTAVGIGNQNTSTTTGAPSGKKKTQPLKIGLMSYTLEKNWDIETIIKNGSETGWVNAELRTTHKYGTEVTLGKQERKEVKKRVEDSPLEAISLASCLAYHSPNQKVLQQNIEGKKEYLHPAANLGAIGVRVFIRGDGTKRVPVIKQINDYAESPYTYINWNCNPTNVEDGGLEENFNMVKDRTREVHMHSLFDESYPYRQFLGLLRDYNPTVYCNAEICQSSEPITLMRYYRALFRAYQNVI